MNIPWVRIIATLAVIGFWWTTSIIVTIAGAPLVNEIAGHQFDSAYGWQLTLGSIRTVGIANNAALMVYGLVLLAIWAPRLKSLWREIFVTFGTLTLVFACSPQQAQAYRCKIASAWTPSMGSAELHHQRRIVYRGVYRYRPQGRGLQREIKA